MTILNQIQSQKSPGLAILIDPDKTDSRQIGELMNIIDPGKVDFFFVGGSHITTGNINQTINALKSHSDLPVVLFPGSVLQITDKADAVLFLSLISGRNPEYLIGQHVIAAPYIEKINIETIPAGYMLIDSGQSTTASYMSNTMPLPLNKPQLAATTALAGELLGLKLIFADAGSGAQNSISNEMIKAIKEKINIPLIIGGGIRNLQTAQEKLDAGADLIVIGNAIEDNPSFIHELMSFF
ncbi:MAG: geranylgeranylglyceryl/heptaprenylglyceryl phosphate synthase [Bacteroidales bacterium]